jgi:hypothetical protein
MGVARRRTLCEFPRHPAGRPVIRSLGRICSGLGQRNELVRELEELKWRCGEI